MPLSRKFSMPWKHLKLEVVGLNIHSHSPIFSSPLLPSPSLPFSFSPSFIKIPSLLLPFVLFKPNVIVLVSYYILVCHMFITIPRSLFVF